MRNFYKTLPALALCLSGFFATAQNSNQETVCPGIPGACGYPSVNTPPDKNTPNPLNGNGSLGQIYNVNKCGLNYVQATLRLAQRLTVFFPSQAGVPQPATFVIAGLPTCRVIERAYLWASMTGTTIPFNVTVTNPLGNTSVYPSVNVGNGADKCWGYGGSSSFRVDVTASISGNGNYVISGFPTNPPTPQKDTDGATLFIIYSDPTANYEGHMVIHDGSIVGIGGNSTSTITGINACANSTFAQHFVMAGDFQLAGTTILPTGGPAYACPWNWWNFNAGNVNVTAGQATCNATVQISPGDCYNWVVSGLYYRTTTCTTCPQSLALTITPTIVQPTCAACNGSISVVVTGGGPPYTYSWVPGNMTTQSISNLCAGTYTLYVTDASCNQTSQVFTLTSAGALTTTQSQTNVLCNGLCTGSATVVPVGGNPPYTYVWTPNVGNTATVNNLCAGAYSCLVTSSNGCTAIVNFTITQPPPITLAPTQVNVTCNSLCNGTATVTASGGTPGYTYVWNTVPVQNTQTATGLCAGNYTVTVTDANGCTRTQTYTITQPTALTATQSQVNPTCFGLCNGTGTVVASGGTPGYTYNWTPSGGNGATGTGLCAGNYTCTITDANGCTITRTFTLTQPTAVTVTATSTPVACFGGSTGTVSATASGGTPGYAYLWTPGNLAGANQSNLPAGTYTVTVTDMNGCTAQTTVVITQPTQVVATQSQVNVLCNGQCTGTATVVASGGTPGYTYNWNTVPVQNAATATGLCAGNYTCTITDANGCTATRTFTITQPTAITLTTSFTQSTCGLPNGSATVTASGGTPGYTYLWNTGATTATISNVLSNIYTVVVTDANGCTATTTVNVPSALSPTASIVSSINVSCFGGNNGSAVATAIGGTPAYTFVWSNAQSGTTATGLVAGTYTVTVTDANGCSSQATVTITQPTQLVVTATGTNVLCNGNNSGSATSTASGATPAYTYLWSNGQTTANATGLIAGTYTIVVTDANGCTAQTTVVITQPTALTIATQGFAESCFGSCDGQIVTIPGGGTTPYAYLWSSGCTTPGCVNICAGTYTIVVTDANGCTIQDTAVVNSPPVLTATATMTQALCGNANGTATVTATGGVGTYTYLWNNLQTGQTATGLVPNTYTVTVTDANGCTTTATVTVTTPNPLTSTATSTNILCFGNATGTANVTPAGGTSPFTYLWSNAATTQSISNLSAGNYSVIVTDANGCTTTATVTITQPTQLVATASQNVAICAGLSTQISGLGTGGTNPLSYAWTPGGPGQTLTVTPTATQTYILTITDANGCTDTASTTVTVNPLPVFVIIADDSSGCVTHCVNFTPSITTGTLNWTYGDGAFDNTGIHCYTTTGAFTVGLTITDANGCSNTITVNQMINVYPLPIADFGMTPEGSSILEPTICFVDGSQGATIYSWDFGDPSSTTNSSSLQNPCHTYSDTGTFCITLWVENANGVVATQSIIV